jgi:hypothetical protein
MASPSPMTQSARWASGARSPEAPTEPFDGMHARVQHVRQSLGDDGAHAAIAERQRVGAQSHDDARFRLGERYREPAGVAAHQVELQAGQLVVRDAHFAELAEAGVDAVDGEAIFGDAAHDVARGVHLGDGGGVDLNADGGVRDGGDFVQRKRLTAELQHSVRIITRDGRFLNRESSVELKYGH